MTPPSTNLLPLLTEAERARMLDDIARVALAVATRLFPERSWEDLDIAQGSLALRKSPVERLGFIARILPDLAQTTEHIRYAPTTQPHAETRRAAPPVRARHVTTSALLRAARSGHAGQWLEESVTTSSVDTPENRAVCSFLETLAGDAAAIAVMADAASDPQTADDSRACAARLRGLYSLPLWEGVGRDLHAWSLPPTHRMLAHPAYARAAHWIRLYRQSFAFDWAHPLFSLPSRDLWQIYEMWGLFQTLHALHTLGYIPLPLAEDASPFAVRHDRLTFRLTKGEPSRIDLCAPNGTHISLFYNRSYPAGRRSLSRTMQPDIALEDPAGRTWILDPKFKAYATPGEEGDDIDQMHAYRDAIFGDQVLKPVQRAWCLFAGSPEGPMRPWITYGPTHESVVGALCLRPGDEGGFARLCALLQQWLEATNTDAVKSSGAAEAGADMSI